MVRIGDRVHSAEYAGAELKMQEPHHRPDNPIKNNETMEREAFQPPSSGDVCGKKTWAYPASAYVAF